MVHLHRHSEFSRLDGVGTAQQYAQRAAEMGQPGLGLTDHGTLSGLLHHIKACKESKIAPICGVEAYYRPDRSIRDKEKRRAWHFCLYAKNLRGWHSLLRLTSIAYAENTEGGGFYQYPCVDLALLEEHSEGLICSTACISGWLCDCIKKGDDKGATKWVGDLKRVFGDDLWLEIMPHDFAEQKTANLEVVNLANEHSLPVITTLDAHVPYKEWAKTQQVAKLLSTKSSYAKEQKRKEEKEDAAETFAQLLPTVYLMTEEETLDLYEEAHPDLPFDTIKESIANTELVMKSTTPFMLSKQSKLPRITKTAEEGEKLLRAWCEEGMETAAGYDEEEAESGEIDAIRETRRERLEYEFGVIKGKGVIDYFLLVGEFVRECKRRKVRVTCRGSAAGCLVSYLIGITPIDPIAYGLLFERFLNPGRKGLPDIDIDVQDSRRDEMKEWLREEHGADHVADIISHSTFQPKSVLLDVARVFDVPYTEVQELNKTIDIRAEDDETTLEEIRPLNETLDKFAKKYPEIWEHANRLEGLVANASKHAAGIVITDKPVADYMPLERGKKGDQVTSWSDRANFPAVSDYGFVKLDCLGVKGLSKQDIACELIKERHDVELDLEDLPVVRDPYAVEEDVMDIFCKGMTLGIWQFGGRGIANLIKQIQPNWLGDLIAANALYRPGAMGSGSTWEYADRKEDPETVDYWDESVRSALEETFGIIAYQEQVMEICKQLGGFSPGQADDMRKAMGKLYRLPGSEAKEFMEGFKSTWDEGIVKVGLDKKTAEAIWEMILSFGGYGFNKSHAACYAVQAYQDAYLKAYYPAEFYMGLLLKPPSTTQKNAEAKAKFIQAIFREADAMGVSVGPPDINKSGKGFTLDGETLRFGLTSIKDVGDVAANRIMENRPYWNWDDFVKRVDTSKVNSKVREALIESGACDRWHKRDEMSGKEMGTFERKRLGMSLTMAGETQAHKEEIEENVWSVEEFEEATDGDEVIVGGDVIDISTTKVKKGETAGREMAFVTVACGVNQWRCTFFPEMWDSNRSLIEGGSIMVNGRKDTFRGESSVVVNAVISIEQWVSNLSREEELV